MKARLAGCFAKLAIAGAVIALCACSGDTNLVRDVAVATGVGTEPKPGPDFVASSRPANVDYVQPGLATRATKAKSAEDVRAFEAAMEQTRAANESKAAAARELGSRPAAATPRP